MREPFLEENGTRICAKAQDSIQRKKSANYFSKRKPVANLFNNSILNFSTRKLQFAQIPVQSIINKQKLFVSSLLNDLSFVEHQNIISLPDG